MILVSACLWGLCTRYDGRVLAKPPCIQDLDPAQALALCPEVMGGLPVPRPPARLIDARPGSEGLDVLEGRARLIDSQDRDVTQAFLAGARAVLDHALTANVTQAFLKDRSPSCAHDPQGVNPKGGPRQGLLTTLLLRHGIAVTEVRG